MENRIQKTERVTNIFEMCLPWEKKKTFLVLTGEERLKGSGNPKPTYIPHYKFHLIPTLYTWLE